MKLISVYGDTYIVARDEYGDIVYVKCECLYGENKLDPLRSAIYETYVELENKDELKEQ